MNIRNSFIRFIKKPENVFISLSLFFGILSAFLVPQLSVNDEGMHYLRTYSISIGRIESGKRCTLPHDVWERARSSFENGNISSDYSKPVDTNKNIVHKCNSASSYSPIMHLPQAVGVFIATLFNGSTGLTILFGRLANILFYSFAIYFIIRWVRLGKWVFTVVGLFPIMIHVAASLSSDAMTNIAIFTIAAATLNLFVQKEKITKKQIIYLITIGIFLALTKSVNILLLAPLAFLPKHLFKNNKHLKLPFNIQKWFIIISVGLIAILSILIWQKIYGLPLLATGAEYNPLYKEPFRFITILFNTYINPKIGYNDIVLRGSIGDFSSFRYHLPLFVIIMVSSIFFLSLLKENEKDKKISKGYMGILALFNIITISLFICAVSYVMYTEWAILPKRLGPDAYYADGVQGRYFTALAVLLVPLGLWAQKYISVRIKSESVYSLLMFCGLSFILGFYIFETFWIYK